MNEVIEEIFLKTKHENTESSKLKKTNKKKQIENVNFSNNLLFLEWMTGFKNRFNEVVDKPSNLENKLNLKLFNK